jgi:hypothetical protein
VPDTQLKVIQVLDAAKKQLSVLDYGVLQLCALDQIDDHYVDGIGSKR